MESNLFESFPSMSLLNSFSFYGQRQRVTPAISFEALSMATTESPFSIARLTKGNTKS
jgi:hypothetical protein